jgi:hypothetical protein
MRRQLTPGARYRVTVDGTSYRAIFQRDIATQMSLRGAWAHQFVPVDNPAGRLLVWYGDEQNIRQAVGPGPIALDVVSTPTNMETTQEEPMSRRRAYDAPASERPAACDGCDQTGPTRHYLVTHHDSSRCSAFWCEDCHDLAVQDYTGTTRTVEPIDG